MMNIPKPEDPITAKLSRLARAVSQQHHGLPMFEGRRVALRYNPEFTGQVTYANPRLFRVSWDSTPHTCSPKNACPHPRNARLPGQSRGRYEYPANSAHCFIDPPESYEVTVDE